MVHRFTISATQFLAYRVSPSVLRLVTPIKCIRPSLRYGRLLFSNTSVRPADDSGSRTHYEVLGLQPSATLAEIKKKFYSLSRTTHPDANPKDPNASARFASISHSYQVLRDSEKRARYDRDVIHVRQRSTSAGGPMGHKGSYAGSRPPSGLSKRRGTFRGPPPSFYTQGGYGTTSNTNSAGASSSTADTKPNKSDRTSNLNDSASGPRPFREQTENTEFDPTPISKTQAHQDTKRMSRRERQIADAQASMAEGGDFWVRVIVVIGILVGTGVLGGVVRTIKRSDDEDVANGNNSTASGKGVIIAR